MKKIFFILISFSFLYAFPTYYTLNSKLYKIDLVRGVVTVASTRIYSNDYSAYCNDASYFVYSSTSSSLFLGEARTCSLLSDGRYQVSSFNGYYYNALSASDCKGTIVDGECVESVTPTCDPIAAQYLSSSTNECVDCMPFTTVSGRASCACDAQGSSYAGQSVLISYSQTYGNYTYQKSLATCANGNQVAVYHDPVANPPADSNTSNPPTDNNSTTPPSDNNTTTPTTDNNTTKPTDSNNADVVKAVNDSATSLKSSVDSVKSSTDAIKSSVDSVKASTDAVKSSVDSVKASTDAVKSSVDTSNTKLDSLVSKLGDANSLSTDSKAIQNDIKTALNAEFVKNDKARSDLDARLQNLIDVQLGASSSLSWIATHTGATTSAVNAQGTAITDKLGQILDAIKDSNGTDMTKTNDFLEKIQGDTNNTVKKLDKLHDDLNSTVSLLDKISGYFDDNKSVQAPDVNDTKFDIFELLPSDSWFDSNKLSLSFNYGSSCYLEPAEIVINGKTFLFPDPTFVESIPFYIIANLMMAYVYLLGLRDFLKG